MLTIAEKKVFAVIADFDDRYERPSKELLGVRKGVLLVEWWSVGVVDGWMKLTCAVNGEW